jgi:hypothetical protein
MVTTLTCLNFEDKTSEIRQVKKTVRDKYFFEKKSTSVFVIRGKNFDDSIGIFANLTQHFFRI